MWNAFNDKIIFIKIKKANQTTVCERIYSMGVPSSGRIPYLAKTGESYSTVSVILLTTPLVLYKLHILLWPQDKCVLKTDQRLF